ncbi:MAG: hypothetical protein Q4B60_07230 [Erysipelotrichaceae bacterium]|nr:hypothetical protein [Erysipelotrichaceae bacterium]
MIRFLLASHGPLAKGMAESVKFIAGKDANIDTICAYMDPAINIVDQIEQTFNKYDAEDTVIVVSDLYGGSVNNELMNLLQKRKFYLIAGMTMSLIIQLVLCANEEDPDTAIKTAISESRSSIVFCNEKFENLDEKEDF